MALITPQQIKAAFGFKKLPFAKEGLSVFEHQHFKEAFAALSYLADRSGIGSLTAPPGCGKSLLLGTFIESLPKTAYFPVYIAHTTCSVSDLYRQILHGFGIEPANRKAELYRRLQERLLDLSSHKRVRPVLIIDESHRLPTAFLEEIRLFTNFDCDRRDQMALFLAGQPQLANTLRLAVHEPLAQRIIIRATLTTFTCEEVACYVNHRLKAVGRSAKVFSECGLVALHKATRGVPRLVDQLAERCFLQACKGKCKEIDSQLVSSVAINSEF